MKKDRVVSVLLKCEASDDAILADLIAEVRESRELDVLLDGVLEILRRSDCSAFLVPGPVLRLLGTHFSTMSALMTHSQASELVALVKTTRGKCKSSAAALLRTLVEGVPLLSANRLRELLKSALLEECTELWRKGERDCAAQLTLCVLHTLLVELAYLEGVSSNARHSVLAKGADAIWTKLTSEFSEQCALLQFCTVLLSLATENDDYIEIVKRIGKQDLLQNCLSGYEVDEETRKNGTLPAVEYCAKHSYNAALFDLMSTNIAAFSRICSAKLTKKILTFMVQHAKGFGLLDSLLRTLSANADLRSGDAAARVEAILISLLPSSHFGWTKPEETDTVPVKRRKREKLVQDDALSWALLLSIAGEKCCEQRLGEALSSISNANLISLLSDGTLEITPDSTLPSLRLLNAIAKLKKSLMIPFRNEFVELMLAEPEPRVQSLRFGAKLLEMQSHYSSSGTDSDKSPIPLLAELVSLCLAMFAPIDSIEQCEECKKREFLLAELAFLKSLLAFAPQLHTGLAPIIIQVLPEFFIQASFYRKEQRKTKEKSRFFDRLEHSLSVVCREIELRKKAFHKFLPFAIAASLTGERELRYPLYLLLSSIDNNDMALLSTNLPATEKRMFALLQSQFYASNRIIG